MINPGGLNPQKSKVIEKIVSTNKTKILIVSETLASASQIPSVGNNMVSFHRNRNSTGACRGGVAIFVRTLLTAALSWTEQRRTR